MRVDAAPFVGESSFSSSLLCSIGLLPTEEPASEAEVSEDVLLAVDEVAPEE
jgi:hypothetical protein